MGNNPSHHEILFGGVPDAKRQAWVRPSTKRKPPTRKSSKPTGSDDGGRRPTPGPGVSEAPPPHSSSGRGGRSHEVGPCSGFAPAEKTRRSQHQQGQHQQEQAHLTSPLSRPDRLQPRQPRLSSAEAAATRIQAQAHAHAHSRTPQLDPNPHRGSNAHARRPSNAHPPSRKQSLTSRHGEGYGGGERRGGRR